MKGSPALGAVYITAVILLAMMTPAAGTGSAHEENDIEPEYHNRYAILDVKYSLTRPDLLSGEIGYPPVWIEGQIRFELYELRAPRHSENFIKLAEAGFYDGTIFHRIIDDFVCQGGDPDANDPLNDGSGETVDLEPHPELTHVDGAVGMARSADPDSAESQFYICDGPQHQLDHSERQNRTPPENGYTVFGVVVEGLNHVRNMATVWTTTDDNNTEPLPTPRGASGLHDRPVHEVTLKKVEVTERERIGGDESSGSSLASGDNAGTLLFLIAIPAILFLIYPKAIKPRLQARKDGGVIEVEGETEEAPEEVQAEAEA